jgi:hypothetical protein
MLAAALRALRQDERRIDILVTPAGFVERSLDGAWSGEQGWDSSQADFDRLATSAASVATELMTPDLCELALEVVDHIVLGIDVWPTDDPELHGEVACLYDVQTGAVRPVTGKSYPTTGQQRDLIRNPGAQSHVIEVGDERLAILVCFDLAAWSPRANANAKGIRAGTWQAMQEAVSKSRPTLAVQLPHTVSNSRTWTAAWAAFERNAGPEFRAGTTAIRHLDQQYKPVPGPFDPTLLEGSGTGERVVDIVVGGRIEMMTPAGSSSRGRQPVKRSSTASRARTPGRNPERGVGLARTALEVFQARIGAYPDGIRIKELADELGRADKPIFGARPLVTLQSALNASQAHGVWHRKAGALWVAGSGNSRMESGLSGRALAEALYGFVVVHYPDHIFHYGKTLDELERSGIKVRGTGNTMRAALAGAPKRFEHIPGRSGNWRWK